MLAGKERCRSKNFLPLHVSLHVSLFVSSHIGIIVELLLAAMGHSFSQSTNRQLLKSQVLMCQTPYDHCRATLPRVSRVAPYPLMCIFHEACATNWRFVISVILDEAVDPATMIVRWKKSGTWVLFSCMICLAVNRNPLHGCQFIVQFYTPSRSLALSPNSSSSHPVIRSLAVFPQHHCAVHTFVNISRHSAFDGFALLSSSRLDQLCICNLYTPAEYLRAVKAPHIRSACLKI